MITTITTDVALSAQFRAIDDAGDVAAVVPSQGSVSQLTPLALMELYEQLHAGRNQVRHHKGLPELPTPDEGVLVLAFLRRLREEPAGSFREVLQRLDAAVQTIQENRLGEAIVERHETETAQEERDWSVIERVKTQRGRVYQRDPLTDVPMSDGAVNGQEPAEVT